MWPVGHYLRMVIHIFVGQLKGLRAYYIYSIGRSEIKNKVMHIAVKGASRYRIAASGQDSSLLG